jgi:hypothetical protein
MALTYGSEGIKQKDYQVYIGEYTGTAKTAADTYLGTQNKTNAVALQTALTELGELRADSISVTVENGDTVEGNNIGEIVLNKACAMVAELINATPDNINALAALDGKAVVVMIKEKDARSNKRTVIVINNVVMSYSENITGGDIPRASISLSRSVANVGNFRIINDIDYT